MNIHNLPTFERLRFADRLVRAIDNEPVLRGMCWSVSSLLLFFALFANNPVLAGEPEVTVTGCVVDIKGEPFKGVEISLYGVNYNGGANYTGNNGVTQTNSAGEFTVRMKAGKPGRPAEPAANGHPGSPKIDALPAKAIIRGKYDVYVDKNWTGGGPAGGTDVWEEIKVENTGAPVDLRPNGCVHFPFPVNVMGGLSADDFTEWRHEPHLHLRFSVDGVYMDRMPAIPLTPGLVRELDFRVDLRPGQTYTVDILKQPIIPIPGLERPTEKMCVQCRFESGQSETIGQTPGGRIFTPYARNWWAVRSLKLHCARGPIVEYEQSCEDPSSVALKRERKMTDDKRQDQGTVKYANGDEYTGDLVDGKLQGQGTFKYANGDEYTGNFVDNKWQGQGTFKTANGYEATGNWVDGKQQGQGTFKYANGDEYTGDLVDGKQQGQGTFKYANGDEYTGNFVDNKWQGQGTFKSANGNESTGNWVDGKQQGQGTFKSANGDEYTGNWVDGKWQGQGTFKATNGNAYTGNWVDNKIQGQGTFKYANGTRFEGEWRDNKPFSGTQISADGTRVEIANGEAVKSPQQAAAAQAKLEEEKKAQERRNWLEQEANKRAAQALANERKQARKKKRDEQDAQDAQDEKDAQETSEAIGTLLGVFAQMEQNKADRAQAQYDNQQRLAQAQQEQQRQVQHQQRTAKVEEDKYYAPLSCASLSSKPSGNRTIPCMQNNCGRTIEVHGNGGMWSAGAGKCLSMAFTEFYAACEKNDGYDRSRNQCRR